MSSKLKACFVIAPIGDEGSEIRQRSDQILKHVIEPTVKECGYHAIRADKIPKPGIITSQIIQHLLDDDLVIADLTSHNPNVFYELAVRHAVRKPVVHLIRKGESIPFDVSQSRTIQVDHHDLDSVDNCKAELTKQIKAAEENPNDVDTPISNAINMQTMQRSGNPLEKSNAEIITLLQEIRLRIDGLEKTEIQSMEGVHFLGPHEGLEVELHDTSNEINHLRSRLVSINKKIALTKKTGPEFRKLLDEHDELQRRIGYLSERKLGLEQEYEKLKKLRLP